jgi:cyclopropane fatty-acyl-phospholipid synthase-like methyltransferase
MSYDDAYRKSTDFFGSAPTDILKDYVHLINHGKPVLDIGAGQGRNTFFLARKGITVDAVDPSRVAVETIKEIAENEELPVNTQIGGFEDFDIREGCYGAVLLFGIIQILSRDEIDLLIAKTTRWLMDGGLVFITAFTVDDPSYERNASHYQPVAKNSFKSDDGQVFTYLEPDELLDIFKSYAVIFHEEGLGPMHRHGNSQPHQHASVKAVLQKK